MTRLDNDFFGLERPQPIEGWSLHEHAFAAERFWSSVAHELDNALIRAVGRRRRADHIEEIYRLQQAEFFVPGCESLGILDGHPVTTTCVLYHCLSTALMGVRSRYAIESPSKAWIFYLPGTGSPSSSTYEADATLAAFRGWYPNNGAALGDEHVAFVVTHLLGQGDLYDAGYFVDTGAPVAAEDRLSVELGTHAPPPPSQRRAAELDPEVWPEARRLKSLRKQVYGHAWDHIAAAAVLLEEDGIAAVTVALELSLVAHRPWFEAALGADGPAFWPRYSAAVREIADRRRTATHSSTRRSSCPRTRAPGSTRRCGGRGRRRARRTARHDRGSRDRRGGAHAHREGLRGSLNATFGATLGAHAVEEAVKRSGWIRPRSTTSSSAAR